MKIITIASTRPELIRLQNIIKKLDLILGDNHIFIHTGQNFTRELHGDILIDLGLRKPDYQFNLTEKSSGKRFKEIIMGKLDKVLEKFNPNEDKILILGDTTGGLYVALLADVRGFDIYHMEAGNRCYDDNVPEEGNRKKIDRVSHKLLTYTQRSRENLLNEGYHPKDIIVVGNPIKEVFGDHYGNDNDGTVLITFHRHENLSNLETVNYFIQQVNKIATMGTRVILSVHPKLEDVLKRNKDKLEKLDSCVVQHKPFKFSEFKELLCKAKCVITDSGTVPEECSIINKPCILIRDSTERPELLEVNQMMVVKPENMYRAYEATEQLEFRGIPSDYYKQTSDIVVKILLGDL